MRIRIKGVDSRRDGNPTLSCVRLSIESARLTGPRAVLTTLVTNMEEGGGKTKKTIFVGGIGEDVDEQVILESFSTFGGSF
jgi:hypothetical protein